MRNILNLQYLIKPFKREYDALFYEELCELVEKIYPVSHRYDIYTIALIMYMFRNDIRKYNDAIKPFTYVPLGNEIKTYDNIQDFLNENKIYVYMRKRKVTMTETKTMTICAI